MTNSILPIPPHFNPRKSGSVWRVDYEKIAAEARGWQGEHGIAPARRDGKRICLLAIDMQNTFCIPGHELFVAGRSGKGAVQDCRRLCRFIYQHLNRISQVIFTMDTHQAMQIFHGFFFVDREGRHPAPMTTISAEDVVKGRWRVNLALADQLGYTPAFLEKHLAYYVQRLARSGKFALTVWPYHAMLGGIGHALAPAFEEALFFHGIARGSQPEIYMKGNHPLTEHYSAMQPEVTHDAAGRLMAGFNEDLLQKLNSFDAIVVAGQAKSHCVAWTVSDMLNGFRKHAPDMIEKVYLLDDCSSAVCIPGVVDFTDEAEAAYARFAEAGMKRVNSTQSLTHWF